MCLPTALQADNVRDDGVVVEPVSEVRVTTDVLEEINQAHGTSFALSRSLEGGFQSGAWLLLNPSGSAAVLKWSPDPAWAGQIQRAGRSVAFARSRGYPTPTWLAVGVTASGYGYQVQEYVTGRPVGLLDVEVARAVVEVLERQAGLDPDPGRSWSAFVTDRLTKAWESTTSAVAATGPAGAQLVAACQSTLDRYDFPLLPSTDLVHGDFRLGNIMFVDGRVNGVIDIEAVGSGTRVFDYATLLDHEDADEEAVRLLVEAGGEVAGTAALLYCLGHVLLDLVLFMDSHVPASPAFKDRRTVALTARMNLVAQMLR